MAKRQPCDHVWETPRHDIQHCFVCGKRRLTKEKKKEIKNGKANSYSR